MLRSVALFSLSSSLFAAVAAQQVGTLTAETHPALSWSTCTAGGSCTTTAASVVLDSNWRWLHSTSGSNNCYTGNAWDATLCPDPTTCAKNCALDGADYAGTYGISTSGTALTLKFKTGTNVGSRVYLMAAGSTTNYQLFKLKNQEFTFDVDVSGIGCGINGALYFSEMSADGGMAAYTGNKAGAKYGTGYCDSQCPHDIKFINGEANILGWNGTSANSGTGQYGTCCNEMDVWEANNVSAAYTPHGCTVDGQYRCQGNDCGPVDDRTAGVCDQAGCDFNSYRMGNTGFYGPGKTVDTTKKFTVVTQFITADGTATGALSEIRRFYVQNNVVIPNSNTNVAGMATYNSITAAFCTAQKTAFGDTNDFANKGGFAPMDKAMTKGMVLVLSIWDDYAVDMLWLDSDYPTTGSASTPGIARGTCATTSGAPADVESQQASAQVIYSNIKIGPIGSTFSGSSTVTGTKPVTVTGGTTTKPTTSTKPTTTATTGGAPLYGQCGGTGWTGPTTCAQGTCKYSNAYYSQCLN